MNRNVILLTQFALVYLLTNFLQLWSLEILCRCHADRYIVSFLVVEMSWKINVVKEGALCFHILDALRVRQPIASKY